MRDRIQYQIPLQDGKTVATLTRPEIIAERDNFTKWVQQQRLRIGNADHAYLLAFKILLQAKQGNSLYGPEDEQAAIRTLEKGFTFSENQQAASKRNTYFQNKGGMGR